MTKRPTAPKIKITVTCTECGHPNELERKQGQLRNVVGRCEGCGASIGFHWQSVRSG
jgi:hypothetical protein